MSKYLHTEHGLYDVMYQKTMTCAINFSAVRSNKYEVASQKIFGNIPNASVA